MHTQSHKINSSTYTFLIKKIFILLSLLMVVSSAAYAKKTVAYNGNGNTSGSAPASVSYKNHATVTIKPQGNLLKTGYTFEGWTKTSDGSGTLYEPGDSYSLRNQAVTFYAKWTTTPSNTPPVANAGADQNIITGNQVTLDGSGSSDTDSDPLTYSWSFSSTPVGSSATLSDPSDQQPTFTADLNGTYVLELVVNDGTVDSSAETVNITASATTASIVYHDNANDICYNEPYVYSGMCSGLFGIMCTTTITLTALDDINDLEAIVSTSSMSGSFMSDCGIDGVSTKGTTCEYNSSITTGPFSMFNKGITYDIADSMSEGSEHSIYDYALMEMSFFGGQNLYATYKKDGEFYRGSVPNCAGVENFLTGPYDAWDTNRDDSTNPPTDRNISTKIAGQPFALSLASLNDTNDAYETKSGVGSDIDVAIYKTGTTEQVSINSITFDANTTAHIADSEAYSGSFFTVEDAVANATVGFKICATYETDATTGQVNYYLYPTSSCNATLLYDCDAPTSGSPTMHVCYSSDNFAVRPDAFKVFGENQYKRAAEDFNITIKATDITNTAISLGTVSSVSGVDGYDKPLANLNIASFYYTPTSAELTQMQTDTGATDVATCPHGGTFTLTSAVTNFSAGEINATVKFSETGVLDINISEQPGSEFAIVDLDDTPDTQRYITPATAIYDQSDIAQTNLLLFIPYQFVTTAEYNTTTGQNWIYISNDVNNSNSVYTTPTMAVYVSYEIEAQNKDGVTTQNYTKTCFPDVSSSAPAVNGLKLNSTFDLFLDMNLTSERDATLHLYTEDNSSSPIWTPNKQESIITGANALQEWISPFQFEDGHGAAKVYFNMKRDVNNSINPTFFTLEDVNTSTSWMSNPKSPNFNGSAVNIAKTFFYGRSHSPKQRYQVVTDGETKNANLYYEIYCYGSDCNTSRLPSTLQTDDRRWYRNTSHTSPTHGTVNSVDEKGASHVSTTNLANTTNPSTVDLSYDATIGYPYQTTMEINTTNWLIYNKDNGAATLNEFQAEFEKVGTEWSGAHETDQHTDVNTSIKTNRRVNW